MADPATDVSNDLVALRNDVARLSATLSELVRQQANSTTERLMSTFDDAQTRLSDVASDAQNRVQAAAADLEASIEKNPMTAVLVALTAGLLIGMMGGHRR